MGKELMMYGVPIKIYAVNGAPRSGKDTLIDKCIYFIENLYYKEVKKEIRGGKGEILLYKWSEYNKLGSPIKYSVIDPIKKILEPIEPIEKEKTLRKRQILSDLKDFLDERLNFTQKEIFNFLKKEVREAKRRNEEELIVFIIAREDKDINFLKEKFKAKTIFVYNDKKEKETISVDTFKPFQAIKYDRVILNTGSLIDLDRTVLEFLKEEGFLKGVLIDD